MSQDDIKSLIDAAAAGSRHAVHQRLGEILIGIDSKDRRLKLAELSAELASESIDIFRLSDRTIVASVIRESRDHKG
jgi:hypothetical protein